MGVVEWLEKIRNAEEKVKKRWLIILSVLCMLLIIAIWLKYFAFLLRPAAVFEEYGGEKGEFSFWQTMGLGLRVAADRLIAGLRELGKMLWESRSYIVKP